MSYESGMRVAVAWLPLPDVNALADASLARWLFRGDITRVETPVEPLDTIAALLGTSAPAAGRASLRFYGQTGDSPSVWMAGADPVYLEPRLDHLFLHAFAPGEVSASEFGRFFNHLQETLAADGDFAFARVGAFGYLRSDAAIETAALSPQAVNQRVPNDYMPAGTAAAAYRQRLSEIEMALHDHEANQERVARGAFPVNSVWMWGGGRLPEIEPRPLPPLFCDDPLLIGFWRKARASLAPFPVSIPEIISITEGGFATMLPLVPETESLLEPALAAIRVALNNRRLDEVRLQFANGLVVTLRRRHRYRYWRTTSPVPELARAVS